MTQDQPQAQPGALLPTPRTDAFSKQVEYMGCNTSLALDLCRQLERELAPSAVPTEAAVAWLDPKTGASIGNYGKEHPEAFGQTLDDVKRFSVELAPLHTVKAPAAAHGMKRYEYTLMNPDADCMEHFYEMRQNAEGSWVKFSDLAAPRVMGLTPEEMEILRYVGDRLHQEQIVPALKGRDPDGHKLAVLASCVRRISASTAGADERTAYLETLVQHILDGKKPTPGWKDTARAILKPKEPK